MVFKKWVKSIQAAAYNGTHTVYPLTDTIFETGAPGVPSKSQKKSPYGTSGSNW